MEALLNVIDHALFEVLRIISEHADASNCPFDDWLVTVPNGLDEIVAE